MTQSKPSRRSVDTGAQSTAAVLNTRAARIYRENLSKMATSSLTKWSSTRAANGQEPGAERPH